MSEIIYKIPDKLEPLKEELELVEAEVKSSKLSNSDSLVSDLLNTFCCLKLAL
jgi:hypothetical protein